MREACRTPGSFPRSRRIPLVAPRGIPGELEASHGDSMGHPGALLWGRGISRQSLTDLAQLALAGLLGGLASPQSGRGVAGNSPRCERGERAVRQGPLQSPSTPGRSGAVVAIHEPVGLSLIRGFRWVSDSPAPPTSARSFQIGPIGQLKLWYCGAPAESLHTGPVRSFSLRPNMRHPNPHELRSR